MKLNVVTFGEPMTMFFANEVGSLDHVVTFSKALAGAETNVATGLSRLGMNVGLVTKLGDDTFGRFITNALNKENIDTSSIIVTNEYQTGMLVKSKVLEGDPEVQYFRKNSAASKLGAEDFSEAYFRNASHLHVTSIPSALSKECNEFTVRAMDFMREEGKTISFDPNLRPGLWPDEATMVHTINELALKCDWFLPGISEGKTLTGYDQPEQIADFYLEKGIKLVVIKLGAEGAFYKSEDESGYVKGFEVKEVVDTVGAGDGFAVGIISALLEKLPVKEAVVRANAIGALAVMSPGDSDGLPTKKGLAEFIDYSLVAAK
ncbi:sugar kinase [Bacillus sp. 1NLA3E]|uniref:sugar kinase n=1 Tax=Bacillus sp. 1NLA3E TaxID=666686 RepID=UPI000247E9A0|nr:sugar kinase [Bacillus sp. 1NLA3E]AGK55824.1 2-dehydro-3-deoxygluconokinase [Bacillus sp. 1NLA3E]